MFLCSPHGITPGNSWSGDISLKDYKIIWEIKVREIKKKKKILGYFHRTIDKMDRDGRNKTQRLCRYGSNYALSKLIVYNGLDDLWGRDNPDSCEFTNYDGSSGTKSRIFRVYTNKKIAKNTKINQIKVSFTDHYNAFSLDRLPWKSKIRKNLWYLNNSILC